MAGFPAQRPPKSHEYPSVSSVSKSRKSLSVSVSESPVSTVSNGQRLDGEKEKVLKALAARNACTERSTTRKRRWQRFLKPARNLGTIESEPAVVLFGSQPFMFVRIGIRDNQLSPG